VTVTTSDLQLRKSNCLKISTDNFFGPNINDLRPHPTEGKYFYAVGSHIDYIGGTNTAIVIKLELLDTYAMSVIEYKELNANFETTGSVKGWNSIDFDADGANAFLTGIFKDSTTTYVAITKIDKNLSTISWMKYFAKKTTSTKTISFDQINVHYSSKDDSLLVILKVRDNTNIYVDYMVNIFSIKASDGSVNWDIELKDYASEAFSKVISLYNPYYNEITLYSTNSAYSYYHLQAIDATYGTLLNNVQVEILKHYQLSGLQYFPPSGSLIQSSDILATSVSGYIMKMNTRKANLDVIDKTSLLRPLFGIHYDNFTYTSVTPTNVELFSYSPASDFMMDNADYEMADRGYIQTVIPPPSVDQITGKHWELRNLYF
jgi:hypothetical protein